MRSFIANLFHSSFFYVGLALIIFGIAGVVAQSYNPGYTGKLGPTLMPASGDGAMIICGIVLFVGGALLYFAVRRASTL
jgi:uncharacterized membrane protein YjjP (DUF1212 family)